VGGDRKVGGDRGTSGVARDAAAVLVAKFSGAGNVALIDGPVGVAAELRSTPRGVNVMPSAKTRGGSVAGELGSGCDLSSRTGDAGAGGPGPGTVMEPDLGDGVTSRTEGIATHGPP